MTRPFFENNCKVLPPTGRPTFVLDIPHGHTHFRVSRESGIGDWECNDCVPRIGRFEYLCWSLIWESERTR